jgi:hypothetical protein
MSDERSISVSRTTVSPPASRQTLGFSFAFRYDLWIHRYGIHTRSDGNHFLHSDASGTGENNREMARTGNANRLSWISVMPL